MAARITVKPLVEQLPCVGGVTVNLLEAPHVDLRLALIGGLDLMVLPGIREAVKIAVQVKRILSKDPRPVSRIGSNFRVEHQGTLTFLFLNPLTMLVVGVAHLGGCQVSFLGEKLR